MAMEEDATTNRRLRVRPAKLAESLLEKDEKAISPLGQRLGSNSKRKAAMTLESLYLQKNYKDPSSTPLETIFESPRPSKGMQQGRASPDAALLMANRKLKRLCIFPSHHQLPRNKLKQRKERALKMKRLTGVQVPLGKAFSEDDVLAVLSCLAEEETATSSLYQEQEREVLDLSNTSTPDLVEGMINVLSSLQMDCEPSLVPPNQALKEAGPCQSQCSKEKKQRCRCDLISQVKAVNPSTPPTSTSTHQSLSKSQPPKTTAWVKRLKRRSGLMFPQKSSNPSSPPSDPKAATSIHPPQWFSRKVSRPMGMEQNLLTEIEQHTTSTKIMRRKLGSKRTPDNTVASSTKKQCTHKTPQETSTDLSPFLQHGKGQGKDKTWVNHYSILTQKNSTSNTFNSSIVPSSSEQNAASPLPQAPFSPQSPPLPAFNKGSLSPTLLNSLIASGGTADGWDGEEGERGVRKEEATSPSSPSARLAALSLHSSPTQLSPLIKPKKVRRRSARLSLGSDIIEGLRRIQNNNNGSCDVPLGTVWAAFSPLEQKAEINRAVNSEGDNGGNDPVLPPPSTATVKKGQSKGKRQSNLYSQLEMKDAMRESSITTTTKSNLDVPVFSFQPISPPPASLYSSTQVPTSLTVVQGSLTSLHHHGTPSTPSMEPLPHKEPSLSSSQPQMPSMKQDIPKMLTLTTTPVICSVPSENLQIMTEEAEESTDLHVTVDVPGEVIKAISPYSGPSGILSTPVHISDINSATHNNLRECLDLSSHSATPDHALTLSQVSLTQGASQGENTTSTEN